MSDPGIPPAAIYTAMGSLVAAIVALFKMVMGKSQEQTELSMRVGKLEGRQEGIEALSQRVLDTVHSAITEKTPPTE